MELGLAAIETKRVIMEDGRAMIELKMSDDRAW